MRIVLGIALVCTLGCGPVSGAVPCFGNAAVSVDGKDDCSELVGDYNVCSHGLCCGANGAVVTEGVACCEGLAAVGTHCLPIPAWCHDSTGSGCGGGTPTPVHRCLCLDNVCQWYSGQYVFPACPGL